MATHREVELKLEIASKDASRLRGSHLLALAPASYLHQESIYFDTPKHAMRHAGFFLRVRRSGDVVAQTIKRQSGSSGLFNRDEWETPVSSMKPDLEAMQRTPARDLLKEEGDAKLQPLARITIDRTSWQLTVPDGLVEVALDEGTMRVGDARQSVSELELELKQGSTKALFGICAELQDQVPLRLGVMSKGDRALAIAEGKLGRTFKAPKVDIGPDLTIAEGLTAIAWSCLQHFRLNEGQLIERRSPEALHQLHIATRRLLSAFRLFRPIIRRDRTLAGLELRLRRLGRKLGNVRNFDVLIALLSEQGADLRQPKRNRERGYDRIIALLNSRRVLKLMIRIVRWLFIGKWRSRPDSTVPLEGFIKWRIERQWIRFANEGVRLSQMGRKRLHRFRIRTKELRYALEFARALHPDVKARRKRFTRRLEALQDQLGIINDRMIARRLAARSGLPTGHIENREVRSSILSVARSDFAELVAVGPYWRTTTG